MSKWKKIITSGSNAHLNTITASSDISASGHLFASLSLSSTGQFVTLDTSSGQFYYSDTALSPPTTNLESLSFDSIVVDSTNTPYIYSPSIVSFTQDDTTSWQDVNIDGDTSDSIDFNSFTSTRYRISNPTIGANRFDALNVIFDFGNPVIVSEFRTTFEYNSSPGKYEMPLQIHVYGKNTEFESGESDGVLLGEGARPGAGGIGLTWSGPSSNPLNIYNSIGQGNNLNRTSSIPETSLTSSFQYYRIRYSGSVHNSSEVYQSTTYTTINQITPVTRSFQASGTSLEVNNGVLNVTQITTNTLIGDVIGDLQGTASYANVANYAVTSSHLPEFSVFNGNRPITNTKFGITEDTGYTTLYNQNIGTDGSLKDFIEQVFFPNIPPSIDLNQFFSVNQFDTYLGGAFPFSGYQVVGQDQDILDGGTAQSLTYSMTDPYFEISNDGLITIQSSNNADLSWNDGGESPHHEGDGRELTISLTDGVGGNISVSIWVQVIANKYPKWKDNGNDILPTKSDNHYYFTGSNSSTTKFLLESNGEGALGDDSYVKVSDSAGDYPTISIPTPTSIYTDSNGNPSFSASINAVNDDGTWKTIEVHQVTSSLDFDQQQHYDFTLSATDPHGFISYLDYHLEVNNNPPPIISEAPFTINEHKATGSNEIVGEVTYVDDDELTDIFFKPSTFILQSVHLNSGADIKSTLSNVNVDPHQASRNPFEITIGGTIKIKSNRGLNSDIANVYIYKVRATDIFNDGYDFGEGTIIINISDDPIPNFSFNTSDGNGHIIESALISTPVSSSNNHNTSTAYIIESSTGEDLTWNYNTVPQFSSLQKIFTNLVTTGVTNTPIANGDISGSTDSNGDPLLSNSVITLQITASKTNFPTSIKMVEKTVTLYNNNAPTLTKDSPSSEEINNRFVHLASEDTLLETISVSADPEGDDIDFNSIVLGGDTTFFKTNHNGVNKIFISASATLQSTYLSENSIPTLNYTLKLKDEHGFRFSNEIDSDITISTRSGFTYSVPGDGFINEASSNNITVKTTEGGSTDLVITSTTTDPGDVYIETIDILTNTVKDIFEIISTGTPSTSVNTWSIRTKTNLRGSALSNDDSPISITSEYTDNRGVTGTGPTFTLNITNNPAPTITTDSTSNVNITEPDVLNSNDLSFIEGVVSSKIKNLHFFTLSDNDTIPEFTGLTLLSPTDISKFSVHLLNQNQGVIRNKTSIPAGTYTIKVQVKDEFDFNQSELDITLTVASPPSPQITSNQNLP